MAVRLGSAARGVEVLRVRDAVSTLEHDQAATEEPLEIRLHNRPFAVVMRTPGSDCELTAGFLLSERILQTPNDLGTITHCTDPGADHPENVVNVTLAPSVQWRLDEIFAGRRNVTTNASCGMCGRVTIDSLRVDLPPLATHWAVPPTTLSAIPDRLRAA